MKVYLPNLVPGGGIRTGIDYADYQAKCLVWKRGQTFSSVTIVLAISLGHVSASR